MLRSSRPLPSVRLRFAFAPCVRWCNERSDEEVIREREAIITEIEKRGRQFW